MIKWAKKIKDFQDENCGGACDVKCSLLINNSCQHHDNPRNRKVAAYSELTGNRTVFRIDEGIPK